MGGTLGLPFHWLHVVFCGCWGACHLMCNMLLFGADKIVKCLQSGFAAHGRAGWGREGEEGELTVLPISPS